MLNLSGITEALQAGLPALLLMTVGILWRELKVTQRQLNRNAERLGKLEERSSRCAEENSVLWERVAILENRLKPATERKPTGEIREKFKRQS